MSDIELQYEECSYLWAVYRGSTLMRAFDTKAYADEYADHLTLTFGEPHVVERFGAAA
jgi:uncharacterized protein YifE (UPF0438 family)